MFPPLLVPPQERSSQGPGQQQVSVGDQLGCEAGYVAANVVGAQIGVRQRVHHPDHERECRSGCAQSARLTLIVQAAKAMLQLRQQGRRGNEGAVCEQEGVLVHVVPAGGLRSQDDQFVDCTRPQLQDALVIAVDEIAGVVVRQPIEGRLFGHVFLETGELGSSRGSRGLDNHLILLLRALSFRRRRWGARQIQGDGRHAISMASHSLQGCTVGGWAIRW